MWRTLWYEFCMWAIFPLVIYILSLFYAILISFCFRIYAILTAIALVPVAAELVRKKIVFR